VRAVRKNRLIVGLLLVSTILLVVVSCATGQAPVTCPMSNQTPCTSGCVALSTDTDNCGACGTACPLGQACVAGACTLDCPNGNLKCVKDGGAGVCVNSKTDNQNCGGCGSVCKAGEICYGGGCSGTCGDAKSGETVCNADAGSPYCANLQTDNQNCGTCGNICSGGQLCESGMCQGTCTSDQTLCGGDSGSPYCADLMSDNANCGNCGASCGGTLQSCVGGACTNQCTTGQLKCGDGGSAYCIDAQTDNHNCGGCGTTCPTNKPVCSGGSCTTVTGGGTVYFTNGTIGDVTYVPCGNGTNTNCTETVAQTSCTNIGLKLVSHASNGTASVVSLGATVSCEWDISYFTNTDSAVAGQCLVGVSNAIWTSCCGVTEWHGNIVTVPATLNQQFGYVYTTDSGYQSMLSNVSGTTWGCQTNATNVPARSGCSTYYVACML
jgi:hypothetical protein